MDRCGDAGGFMPEAFGRYSSPELNLVQIIDDLDNSATNSTLPVASKATQKEKGKSFLIP